MIKCLVNMEKALNLCVKTWTENVFPIESSLLHQKALSLYKDISEGSAKTSDLIHINFITIY